MKKGLWILWIGLLSISMSIAEDSTEEMEDNNLDLSFGVQLQKEHNGYWHNGLTLSGTHPILWSKRFQFSVEYLSSRFGSAHGSNAVNQDRLDFISGLHFRPTKFWDPYIGIVTGYYHLDTEGFQVYPDDESTHAFTYGAFLGSQFNIHPKWGGLNAGFGFNIKNGPGVAYPLYFKIGWTVDIYDRFNP